MSQVEKPEKCSRCGHSEFDFIVYCDACKKPITLEAESIEELKAKILSAGYRIGEDNYRIYCSTCWGS